MALSAHLSAPELRELIGTRPSAELAAYFGVTQRTLRAWLTGRSPIPLAVARLALARFRGHLEAIFGEDAAELFIVGGLLLVPGWRRGLTLAELRALWVTIQGAASLQSRVRCLEAELEARNACELTPIPELEALLRQVFNALERLTRARGRAPASSTATTT